MKTRDLNDWLGVITNIGLIAGLVLVAYQIHQNNIALEREARISEVEVSVGIRTAWQNWEYAIIENRDISDIWMRGNAGEPLDPLEEFRYELVAKEKFRLTGQNYWHYSTFDGAPADWAVWQLAREAKGNPRLTAVYMQQLGLPSLRQNAEVSQSFRSRVKELDPPEFRTEKPDN